MAVSGPSSSTGPQGEGTPLQPAQCYDLRYRSNVPKGKCVYIQSGDPGDFDGAARAWMVPPRI